MREIKFRVWNKKEKKWESGGIAMDLNGDCEICWTEFGELMERAENVILCQYTGLKDKNGREIYEGDVAGYEAWTGLDRGEIVWGEKECAFFWEGITDCQPLGDIYQDIEIIGNIWENGDLLND